MELLNEHGRRHQFAAHWTVERLNALAALGLNPTDLHLLSNESAPTACAGLWDQRAFKQTVVRGYASRLARWRPLIDLAGRLTGGPRLPPVGTILASAMVTPLVSSNSEDTIALIRRLAAAAAARRLDSLILGLAANDPRLDPVRTAFRGREYHSRLYVVSWPGLGLSAGEIDDRILAPEVAWL